MKLPQLFSSCIVGFDHVTPLLHLSPIHDQKLVVWSKVRVVAHLSASRQPFTSMLSGVLVLSAFHIVVKIPKKFPRKRKRRFKTWHSERVQAVFIQTRTVTVALSFNSARRKCEVHSQLTGKPCPHDSPSFVIVIGTDQDSTL